MNTLTRSTVKSPRVPFEELAEVMCDRQPDGAYADVKNACKSVNEKGQFVYDESAHMKFIGLQIEAMGLSAHVSIREQPEGIDVPETNEHYPIRHKVRVKGVTLVTGHGVTPFVVAGAGVAHLEFEDCTFVPLKAERNCYCSYVLGQYTYLRFHRCVFEEVDIYVGSLDVQLSCVLDLANNRFENRHTTVGGDVGGNASTNGWTIRPEVLGQVTNAKAVERSINEFKALRWQFQKNHAEGKTEELRGDALMAEYLAVEGNDWIEVKAEHVAEPKSKTVVRVANNCFTTLNFGGVNNFHFTGRNVFQRLENDRTPAFVAWGQYQAVDRSGQYAWHHKDLFVRMKQRADARKDTLQSMILEREIRRCERRIVAAERIGHSWQDRVIFWFGENFSSYGTSWGKPLVVLALANAVIAWVAQHVAQSECGQNPNCDALNASWLGVYAELFYPLAGITEVLGASGPFFSALNVVHKALFAVVLYEVVKTLRRFGRPG